MPGMCIRNREDQAQGEGGTRCPGEGKGGKEDQVTVPHEGREEFGAWEVGGGERETRRGPLHL